MQLLGQQRDLPLARQRPAHHPLTGYAVLVTITGEVEAGRETPTSTGQQHDAAVLVAGFG